MALGRAAKRAFGVVCALLVFVTSNLLVVNLNIPDFRMSFAATEHLSHGALAQHIGKTMPHAHDQAGTQASGGHHHHSHGVPAPDENTPASRAVVEPLEILASIILSIALLGMISCCGSLPSQTVPRIGSGLLAYVGKGDPCTALIGALVLAPQAPPALAS